MVDVVSQPAFDDCQVNRTNLQASDTDTHVYLLHVHGIKEMPQQFMCILLPKLRKSSAAATATAPERVSTHIEILIKLGSKRPDNVSANRHDSVHVGSKLECAKFVLRTDLGFSGFAELFPLAR